MYIFELIAQLFKTKKYKQQNSFDPLNSETDEYEDSENCNHMFLPLDSSNTLFACKYCGLIMPREKLKDRNIFRNNN
jgi:hypothetical protein